MEKKSEKEEWQCVRDNEAIKVRILSVEEIHLREELHFKRKSETFEVKSHHC